jgi:hypothetical protein
MDPLFLGGRTMRIRLVVGFALAAAGLSAYGCSSSTNPYPDASSFCTAYAKAICQVSTACQFDASQCQTYQQKQCGLQAEQAVAAGTRAYSAGNVQACIDAVTSAYKSASVDAATYESVSATCAKVFVGSAGEGASCKVNGDCAVSGEICASTPGQAAVCAKPTPKDLNAACADPGDQCPANAYCNAQTLKCTAAQSAGQSCNSETLPCDGGSHCVSGTCVSLGSSQASCSSDTDCGSGLFCDPYTSPQAPGQVCVSQLGFGRASNDCLGIEGQTGSSSGGDAGGSSSGNDAGGSSSGGDASSSSGGDAGGSSSGDASSD